MSYPWEDWDHITKIDPDKDLVDGETFEDVCETGTDALEIGGTLDITEEKMERVVEATAKYDVPIYQEPSNPAVVIDDDALDGYLIPTVFNSSDSFWITGAHKEWVRIEDGLDWDRTHTEAYIVLNPDSSVAEYTEADTDQSADDVASFARVAEKMFGQDIVYIEYSGTYGDPEKVCAAHDALDDATLFYGGGIHDYESAHEMGTCADVVVVGDLLHDKGVDAVRETVEGAKDASAERIDAQ
ncbi:geranylgeranylglyceryl phosphate synthase-like protein [Haloferax mucosum ATCC BAA-1512]|uniref:Geranylgeranylglyceryl phosphate synthase n=1 Tax=Haloferax mucosum ATCC BAA-1512 TaxID=662479 RepID=M0I7A6_9EURY|nr:putative phosphoglycerol geranylgeranyltransferase [Haloferax mucosum]ELZ91882.1 geranylgeranylglyceryl phosphate synthase-like protein [Haloferax mucosum ATCC BAA-1512]